ncbi:MAG: DNA polymerase III subunit delta [Candidatus Dormibacteria bacterium]
MDRKRLQLFHGGEHYLVDQAYSRAWREATVDLTSDLDAEQLDPSATPEEVLSAVSAVGFFSPGRVVGIRGWRILAPRPGRRGKPQPEDPGARAAELLAELPEGARLLLCLQGTVPAGHPVLSLARSTGVVEEFPRMRRGDVAAWAQRHAREVGLKLDPGAMRLLLSAVGEDLRMLDSEMAKLQLFGADNVVREADVAALVPDTAEHQIWDLTDALIASPGRAIVELDRALAAGEPAGRISFMLVRHLRMLLAAGAAPGGPAGVVAITSAFSGDGRPLSEYSVKKAIDQVRGVPRDRLERLYRRAAAAEASSRRGELDEEAALRVTVMGAVAD